MPAPNDFSERGADEVVSQGRGKEQKKGDGLKKTQLTFMQKKNQTIGEIPEKVASGVQKRTDALSTFTRYQKSGEPKEARELIKKFGPCAEKKPE